MELSGLREWGGGSGFGGEKSFNCAGTNLKFVGEIPGYPALVGSVHGPSGAVEPHNPWAVTPAPFAARCLCVFSAPGLADRVSITGVYCLELGQEACWGVCEMPVSLPHLRSDDFLF